ncbi:MAG TPA: hypothetical protein VF721_05860 [Pyrinomonadaceae bacterium]
MNCNAAVRNQRECFICEKPSTILLALSAKLLAVYPSLLRLSLFIARLMQ